MRLSLLAIALPLILALLGGCSGLSTGRESSIPTQSTEAPGGFGFLVVGDTGYVPDEPGKSGLVPVAEAMREYCRGADCRFGLMAGDNIYPDGAAGDAGDAERFRTRFTEPFAGFADLQSGFRFYVALGNHDWRTSRAGALAEVRFLERNPPFHMNGLFYSVRPPGLGDQVEIFVIDTEMLLAPLMLPEMDDRADGTMEATGEMEAGGGRNALPASAAERDQLGWLEQALARSTAKWKLVMGHHPLWQSRADVKYEQSIALRNLLLPMLCRYADAYFAGHQHTLEVAADSCTGDDGHAATIPLPNIVSGAGSKAREIDALFRSWQQKTWSQLRSLWADGDQWGFSHVTLQDDRMVVRMLAVDRNGTVMEAFRHSFADRADPRDDP